MKHFAFHRNYGKFDFFRRKQTIFPLTTKSFNISYSVQQITQYSFHTDLCFSSICAWVCQFFFLLRLRLTVFTTLVSNICVLHVLPISYTFILFERDIKYESPRIAVFSNIILLPLSHISVKERM